jgi:hypothetical protein
MTQPQPRPRKYSDNTHEHTPILFISKKLIIQEPLKPVSPLPTHSKPQIECTEVVK